MAVNTGTIATSLARSPADLSAEQEAQWSMWIGDALMLIQDRFGDLSALNQTKLDYVTREAVKAQILRFEDAMKSATDDQMESSSRFAGRIMIIPEWWSLLDVSPGTLDAFSIQPYFEPDVQSEYAGWTGWTSL